RSPGKTGDGRQKAAATHPGSSNRAHSSSTSARTTSQERPEKRQRSTRPVLPEHSAIADEFRTRLHGKPTRAGHRRTWYGELLSAILAILKIVLILVLCLTFVVGGFGAGMLVGYVTTTTPVETADIIKSDIKKTSFVYDVNGDEIARLTGSENIDRVEVSFLEIKSTYIDEAIVAIEDERFMSHTGIDVKRIASAVLSALFNFGSASHGGSTITQQTVKLISGQDERSAQRKVQEWYRAMWLEESFTKDEILDLYINNAPMGNNYIGVQAAAQNYFGKDAKDLTLPECAFLAGLPKSPSYYNPLRESGKRNAMRRMRIVLEKMHELEMITDDQYEEALNTELVFKSRRQTTATAINSYFVEYAVSEVISDLQKERNISYSLAETLVLNRGFRIYTTLEPEIQTVMDEAFMNKELFQNDPDALEDLPEKPQGGMVIINVQTGAIAGMSGGYGEKVTNRGFNRATMAYRQPGSSIKPLIVYAPALQTKLLTAATIYDDKKSYLDPDNPNRVWPKNADGSYDGPMTIRRAITASRNTIAVQVWTDLYERGEDIPLWYLKRVGIDRMDEKYPGTALGGFLDGMTPLEMAAAYATFPNEGTYREPFAYTKVYDSYGNLILENRSDSWSVYSPEVSFIMSDIMKGVITGGTATGHVHTIKNVDGESIAVAGKTGTTEVDDKDIRDKWFCGYTPYYAAAVWYGFDNHLRTTAVLRADRFCAMEIWDYVMQKIHQELPGADFNRPDTIIMRTVCTSSGQLANEYCKKEGTAVSEYFIAGDYLTPTSTCTFHVEPTPTPEPTSPTTAPTG
ncbi:MAG: transglycosylase domain-containing protein, partial [Clostridiales bacterium]|nr:transglycosylase domain-containing protein [Clostridiales bacterium]